MALAMLLGPDLAHLLKIEMARCGIDWVYGVKMRKRSLQITGSSIT